MELCPNCRKEVENEPDFCPYCKFKLVDDDNIEKRVKRNTIVMVILIIILVIATPFLSIMFLFP